MSGKLHLDNRCRHTFTDGHRCRMLRMKGHPSLCLQHQRQQLQPHTDPKTVAAELLGSIQDFKTATAVNQALARLFALLASHRLPPRNAAVLAYICQLLLLTLPAVQQEITRTEGYSGWQHTLRQALQNLRSSKSSDLAETILKPATQAPSDKSRTAS